MKSFTLTFPKFLPKRIAQIVQYFPCLHFQNYNNYASEIIENINNSIKL